MPNSPSRHSTTLQASRAGYDRQADLWYIVTPEAITGKSLRPMWEPHISYLGYEDQCRGVAGRYPGCYLIDNNRNVIERL